MTEGPRVEAYAAPLSNCTTGEHHHIDTRATVGDTRYAQAG